MSTLSEIAANHANTAKALQAQAAASREACTPVVQHCEPAFKLPAAPDAGQMAPHTFVASSENRSAHAVSLAY